MPVDLLDRLVIIRTLPYSVDEIIQIVAIRAQTEGLIVGEEAMELLGKVGHVTSLRYCLQLLAPAAVVAATYGRENRVEKSDIGEIDGLFFDAKSSARMLIEHKDKYIS
ncbi:conserved hypothetical protein [Perkinsus marinus ATCC 50983]|uniref:RuvB-like helicase n=1 Tax=Perkinsus marinus (strain ATCC 50983 / TXsc) TaxID=423536 RepID=C5LZL1_PERM5|nr:conserved hypothetical protein [Perkinsus marinus ATCC 50983]EEQ97826.1 conserved hypothetical protein [Perkinsus marinus ATCC 50983]|eukprot:XP_002765109.1 conserved hypothetical protein [Perkinsus marinus ATCC 50983]